jgi:hypothetical protein
MCGVVEIADPACDAAGQAVTAELAAIQARLSAALARENK